MPRLAAGQGSHHAGMEDRPLTVAMLTRRIAASLDGLNPVLVQGELSQAKVFSSGHWYATLKDSEAVVGLVMWRSTVVRHGPLPKEGERVVVKGRLEVYGQRGQYQIIATRIASAGQGDLAARFAALKERLAAEGLFAEERKRPLPLLPRAVGIATAAGSAALADIISSLRRRFPAMPIIHAPCLVQGEAAAASIVAALERLQRHPEVEVIICGRGGGSLEDLWAFNEESVVRAIAACARPVISAVGHETDVTLADFAADLRAKTPTEAGEVAVPVAEELRLMLAEGRRRLTAGIGQRIDASRQRLAGLLRHRALQTPQHQVELRRQRLDERRAALDAVCDRRLAECRSRLGAAAASLDALSPLAVLGRGFSVLRSGGRVLRRCAEAPPGTAIEARLCDGWLDAKVAGSRPLIPG